MASLAQPYVLVLGATGHTGPDLIDGLLRSGGLRMGAISRSATSPAAEKLKAKGVEIRVLDVTADSEAKMVETLQGVDILLSVVSAEILEAQRGLFAAAAKVPGIKRVIPSDFSTPCPRGIMSLQDRKLEIHDYIRELGLPYTFIDVGWWSQLSLPYPPSFPASPQQAAFVNILYKFHDGGKVPVLVTDRLLIGDFVGRIIKDERTLNQYVIVHEDEVTMEDVWKMVEQISPEGKQILAKRQPVSLQQTLQERDAALAALAEDKSLSAAQRLWMVEYDWSVRHRGDNTLAKAKAQGALVAKDLYPDVRTKPLHEYARAFYAAPQDIFQ